MAHGFTVQGGLGAGASIIPHKSSAHSVLVPDTELLFTAQFHRAGPDLVLTGRDGQHHLIPGYFSSEHHPALVAPNGAHLSPDTVDLLAGSATPGHYAQAQPTAPPDAIGKIEKVVGDVSVVRNGVTVALHVGDAVFKSDVVQAGASASCGISFPDGTVLNLVANTRMALNDYAYDANSNANGALFTLVEGTFAFVAGKVAHSGDMKIATPVATMGIRGTTGVVQQQPDTAATITANAGGHTYTFAVMPDIGTGITGMWDVYLTDANGIIQRDANGNPIVLVTVSQSGYVTYLTPQGLGERPLVSTMPATNSDYAFEQNMLQELFRTLNPANLNGNGNNGSSSPPPPFELPNPIPQLFEDTGKPFTINFTNGSNPTTPTVVDIVVGPTGPLTVVIWVASSPGKWSTGSNWLGGAQPTSPQEVEILTPIKVTADGNDSAAGLVIVSGATVNIISGATLTILDFIHGGGTIQLNSSGSDPTLAIHGTVSLVGGGMINMIGTPGEDNILGVPGTGALLLNIDYTIEGTGTIGGGDGNLTFQNFGTVNANDGLLTINTGNQVYNDGLMEATVDPLAATVGTLQIKDSVANAGTVQADGVGTVVELSGATFDNLFSVVAKNGGTVTFTGVAVTNEAVSATDPAGGTINAAGGTITFDGGSIANGNVLEATNGGTLQLENLTVNNTAAGELSIDASSELDLMGAAVMGGSDTNLGNVVVTDGASVLHGDSVANYGTMTVEAGASLTLEGDTTLLNEAGGLIKADGAGATVAIELDTDTNVNSGTIEAVNGGEVDFHVNVDGGSNHGLIEAGAGGTVHFFGHHGGGGGPGGGGDKGGNFGTMEAIDGGVLIFDGGIDNFDLVGAFNGGLVYLNNGIKNHAGTVDAAGAGSQISISGGDNQSENADQIHAEHDGVISLASVMMQNDAGATIAASSGGSISWITGGIDNFGMFSAGNNGTITFGGEIGITNESTGIFQAALGGSIDFGASDTGSVTNDGGTIVATDGGTITFDSTLNGAENIDGGIIEAGTGGTIIIDGFQHGNQLSNAGNDTLGTIEAIGTGAKVELSSAKIFGGKLHADSGGIFETVSGTSTLINVIITGGVFSMDADTILDLNGGFNGVAAYIDSTVIFEGAGVVEMDSPSTSILGGNSNGTLQNETTIEGQGTIGSGDTALPGVLTLINSGTIEALGGEFTINTGTRNSATTTNTGTLEANGANAVLLIHHSNMNDAAGTIAAVNDLNAVSATASVVELLDDVIVGGTLRTSNFGTIETVTDNGAASTTVFDGVTNLGYVFVNEKTTLVLRNTIDQTAPLDPATGKITLGDDGNATLAIDGTVTLSGGQVELDDSSDKIVGSASGATLHNTATIDGMGKIGADDLGVPNHDLTFDNQAGGVVDADHPDGAIVIWTGNTVTNAGTLEATNNGFLQIADSVINQSTGTIDASGLGSEVEFLGTTLDNFGRVVADLNATISVTGGVTNESTGTIEATNSGTIFLSAVGVTNYGLIEADHGGRIFFQSGFSLSNLAGGTIEATGAGAAINFNGLGTVDNDASTIEAINGGAIAFDASVSSLVNKSGAVIEAGSGGTVTFAAITVTNSSGTIEALGSNSAVDLNGTTINGGTLETDSAGVVDALTGTSTFDGVTIGGGFIKVESSATVDLEHQTTISGTVTFEGGGTFMLDDPPVAASIVAGATGGTLDIAAGATLNGSGDIGNGGATSLTLNNAGTIDGDGAEIDIETGNTVTNTGLIEATNDGSLVIFDAVNNYGATPGTVKASDGGSITLLGTTVDSGSNTAGVAGGTIEADTGSSIEFDTVTTVSLGSSVSGGGGTLDAAGPGATIAINGATVDAGSTTAGGGGTIEASCGGSVTLDNVTVDAAGATIEASHSGAIILSNGTLNDGSDTAGVAGGLVEATGCDSTVTFQGDTAVNLATTVSGGGGTVEATHGGAIIFDGSTVTAAGATIEALHGGSITFETEGSLDASSAAKGIAGGLIEASGDYSTITFDNFAVTLDSSVTNGGGTIEAGCGGAIIFNGGTINSVDAAPTSGGLIEALAGGTITFNSTVIYNQGSTIEADGACAAIVLNGATISGGTLETSCGRAIAAGAGGSTLDNLTIASGAQVEVDSGATLTLAHTINSDGTITVDSGATLYLNNLALDGGTIKDIGTVEMTVDSTIGGGAVIDGDVGSLVVDSGRILTLDTATLENLDVTNHGALDVNIDTTLTLSNVNVHGGAIDGADATTGDLASTIDVTGDSTFCGVHLSGGDLTVESNVTLTLSGDRVSDVAIAGTDALGCIVASTIDVTGDSTFCDVSLSGGNLTVESAHTLTLDNTTLDDVTVTLVYDSKCLVGADLQVDGILTLDDTTIAGQSGIIHDGGTIDVIGSSEIDDVSLSLGKVKVESNQTLTLDNAVFDGDTVTLVSAVVHDNVVGANLQVEDTLFLVNATINGTGTIHNCGTIDVQGNGSQSEIDGVTIANYGSLEIDGGATLALNDVAVHGGSIDGTDASGCIVASTIDVTGDSTFCNLDLSGGNLTVEGHVTLSLSGVVVDGTNIDDYTDSGSLVIPGTIHVIGDSAINSSTVDGEGGPADNGTPGAITVDCNVTLTLDNTTLEDLHVTDHGTLQVDGTDTLTLNTVQIDGGTINNFTDSGDIVAGNIDITGDTTFGDLAVEKGNLTIDDSTALKIADDTTVTFDGVHVTDNGALDVGVSSGAVLALNGDAGISGCGAITINANGTLDVDGGTTTINLGGTITNNGTLEASGGGTLDIVSHVDNGSGALLATSGGVLEIESAICGGSATIYAATLEFDASSNVNVTFDNGDGNADYGLLILKDPVDFSGTISGFHGTAPDAADSDEIELADFAKASCSIQCSGGDQILTLTDANGDVVTLKFVDFHDTLTVTTDGDNTYIYDPPAVGAKDAPAAATVVAGNEHTVASVHQDGTDHATSPANDAGFGSDQPSVVTSDATNGGNAASATNELASAHVALAPGIAGAMSDAAFGEDEAGASPASETDAGALTNGLQGGATQTLLSSLLNVLIGGDTFASIAASASGGDHGAGPAVVAGSGAANGNVTLSTLTTAPGNEHVTAPALAASPTLATSPTLASATFGTSGNDSFAFHANLGGDAAQNAGAPASELAHNNIQVSGPALGSTAPEFHAEFALDIVHQDDSHLAATADQFHQMAASSTLLH